MTTNTIRRPRAIALLLALVLATIGLGYSAVVNKAAWLSFGETNVKAADSCPDKRSNFARQTRLWTPVTTIRGPAFGEVWWNNLSPSANKAWNPGIQPPWGQRLIKFKVNRGVQLKLFGASVLWRQFASTKACQAKVSREYRAKSLPGKSLNQIEQSGMGLKFRTGK